MDLAIGVQREPFAHEWQPIGEIKGSEARAGIVSSELVAIRRRREAEEAVEKSVQRDGSVAFSAPNVGALEAELEIFGWPETHLLNMHPGIPWSDHIGLIWARVRRVGHISVSMEAADEKFVPEWAGDI